MDKPCEYEGKCSDECALKMDTCDGEERNYLEEAKNIIAGTTMLLPEKIHLEALQQQLIEKDSIAQGLRDNMNLYIAEHKQQLDTTQDKLDTANLLIESLGGSK